MLKILAAVAGAAVLAAAFALVTGMTPVDSAAASAGYAKADTLDMRFGAACSERGWPYYEPGCIHSAYGTGESRSVRIVTTDRLPADFRPTIAR